MKTIFSDLYTKFLVRYKLYDVCTWCKGTGIFKDTDFFPGRGYSYQAIPICGGCGGLGVHYNTSDFKARTAKIAELRFKYYPTDKFPEPPSIVPFTYLAQLIKEVEQLVKIYKVSSDCYAARLIRENSHTRSVLKMFEELVQVDLSVLKENNPELPAEYAEENQQAMIALFSGEFVKGFTLFESLLEKHPEDGTLWHDFAVLQMLISRDDSRIDDLWKTATSKKPQKALHFFQAGKYYWNIAENPFKALTYLKGARNAPDWAEFQVTDGVDLDELIRLINEDIYFSSPYKYQDKHE